MINSTANLVDAFRELLDSQSEQIWTTLPGSIISYDKATHLAQVKLEIKLPLATGELLEMPPIDNVPVQGLETIDFILDIDYPKGTGCILLFSSVAIGNYLQNTSSVIQSPENLSKFSLTDAIAIPTIYPSNKRPDKSKAVMITIGSGEVKIINPDGSKLELLQSTFNIEDSSGNKIISSASSVSINGNLEVLK